MKRFTVDEVMDYLVAEDVDFAKLRSVNGLELYKDRFIFMYGTELLDVNVLLKISQHTATTNKKVLGL
ncbi:hypothetical protein [Enterobacter kobei]|uniref:hypothetical protein n=1 Tax=Enterobacter kobei TaxID=208224 RepID=UPI002002C2F9|nr:hypothetical protein [Enterobacter kobei]MCK7249266.1 hypothetical protein [Enterobacter kobei]